MGVLKIGLQALNIFLALVQASLLLLHLHHPTIPQSAHTTAGEERNVRAAKLMNACVQQSQRREPINETHAIIRKQKEASKKMRDSLLG